MTPSPATLADWEVCKVVTLGLEGVARVRGEDENEGALTKRKKRGRNSDIFIVSVQLLMSCDTFFQIIQKY